MKNRSFRISQEHLDKLVTMGQPLNMTPSDVLRVIIERVDKFLLLDNPPEYGDKECRSEE